MMIKEDQYWRRTWRRSRSRKQCGCRPHTMGGRQACRPHSTEKESMTQIFDRQQKIVDRPVDSPFGPVDSQRQKLLYPHQSHELYDM